VHLLKILKNGEKNCDFQSGVLAKTVLNLNTLSGKLTRLMRQVLLAITDMLTSERKINRKSIEDSNNMVLKTQQNITAFGVQINRM